ncbi:MAG: hypothetical protein L6V93_02640 [Clostridiales bacterium]|nr:MAG: hypothetical protein L6V93_02640 [Clostridiales bacterium]
MDNITLSKRTANALSALVLSLFLVGSASEFFEYKSVYETDKTVCEKHYKFAPCRG